jgi:hypothetical protein
MQRRDPGRDVPDTNFDLLNENRGVGTTRDPDADDQPFEDAADDDELVAGESSGGQPIAIVVDETFDGATTGPNDRDQADDAQLERERAR